MNNLSFILYSIIALVVIIVIVIVIILIMNSKSSSQNNVVSKKDFFVSLPSTYQLELPAAIDKMSVVEVKEIARKVYDAFKVFDYKNMDNNQFAVNEWHSWQVSIMLMVYKRDEELILPNQEKVFHDTILTLSENDVKSLMKDIIKKYERDVDFTKLKDELCRDYIWSYREVSIIFYFLANYKHYTA